MLARYTLDKVLGVGGFGYIYVVTEAGTSRKAVMKVVIFLEYIL